MHFDFYVEFVPKFMKMLKESRNNLNIVWTYGPFIVVSLRSFFIREEPISYFPPSFSLVSRVQKIGRPLPVWMQSTEICMRTEGDHRRPLWTFLFFLSFFFLSTPQSQITESFHSENSVIFSCLISSSFTLKNKLNFTLEMTSFNDCLNSNKGSRVDN